MSLFENFITEGNETSDELAKEGAMMDGGAVAPVRERGPTVKRKTFCSVAIWT